MKTYRVDHSKEPPRLSTDELRRLIAAVDLNGRNGVRDLAILQVFLQCGLRVGELVRLSRDDVNCLMAIWQNKKMLLTAHSRVGYAW